MKKGTKLMALLMTLIMTVAMLPLGVFADNANVAKIGDTEYPTLKAAVDAVTDSTETTITLLRDVTDGVGIIVPQGKNIVFDFDGYTYKVTNELAGSSGTETQCFQLCSDSTIVMKNGTIQAGNNQIAMLVQNYSNLTLDGMTLDGTTMTRSDGTYTLSNNNGDTVLTGGTVITAQDGDKNVAFDVCRYSIYPSVSVTVKDATINGKIEMSTSNNEVKDGCDLIIEGGDLTKAILDKQGSAANASVAISGGSFAPDAIEDLKEYLDEGLVFNTDGTVTTPNNNNNNTNNNNNNYDDDNDYEEEEYTLTFDVNGGDKIKPVTRDSGSTINLTRDRYIPTREGYTFDGWYSNAKLTKEVKEVTLYSDKTVYAKWVKNAPETGKENPAMGADDFVGVAVALAVVSVAGAVALSKKH